MSEYICFWQDYSICCMVNWLQWEVSGCEDYLLKMSKWKVVVHQDGDENGEAHLGGRIIWCGMCGKRRYSGSFMYEQQSVAGIPRSHCDFSELILPFFPKWLFLLAFGFVFWHHHALLDCYLLKVCLILLPSSVNLT